METVDLNFRFNATGNAVPELRRAQGAVKRLDGQIQKSNARMRGFNNGITSMQANTRKFAMGGLQQAGYQVGDYAVQVANGTSKMQAFGQQAPQLLQIFGPIGAVVGAGVAIFAAFAVVLQRSKKAAKEATDTIVDLDGAYRKLEKIDSLRISENLSAPALAATQKYKILLDAMELVAEQQRVSSISNILADMGPLDKIASLKVELEEINDLIQVNSDSVQDTSDAQETLKNLQSETLRKLMSEVDVRGIILSIAGKTRAEAADNLLSAMQQLDAMGRLTPELRAQLVAYAEQAGLLGVLEEAHTSITGSISKQGDELVYQDGIMRSLRIKTADMKVLYDQMVSTQAQRLKMLRDEDIVMSQLVAKSIIYTKSDLKGGRSAGAGGSMKSDATKEFERQLAAAAAYKKMLEGLSSSTAGVGSSAKVAAVAVDEELSPAMKRLKTVQETVSSSFEQGFMSIVDGTASVKDAFKAMASSIIKELFRIFVVKRITGFISNAIGGYFNMNQVSGPSMPLGTGSVRPQARTFSGGGYTGSGARAGGLDGKGGYMAMVHPRETVVDHTKGQGSGGVTIIQNNTFGSGVSRAEVNGMLPKMIEATKAAVVDAKRQGGSYGRAFA